MPPASLLCSSRLSAGACAQARLPCASYASLATFWLMRMSYQEGIIGYGNGSRQDRAQAPTGETDVGLGGSDAGETIKEKGRRTGGTR